MTPDPKESKTQSDFNQKRQVKVNEESAFITDLTDKVLMKSLVVEGICAEQQQNKSPPWSGDAAGDGGR